MWINNNNICTYNKSQDCETDLYYIVDWFCDKIEYIVGYDEFPLPVKGNSALELIKNANEFDNNNSLEFNLWYAAKSRWVFNHCWFSARGGSVLPCVYFRRVKNLIEISWDNSFWEKHNIVFNSRKNVFRINVDDFSAVFINFLLTIICDLKQRVNNVDLINKLEKQIIAINS